MPSYLSIGMSAEEFWHGDPWLAKAYQRAHGLRRERAYRAEWREGYYAYIASIAASPFNKSGFEYPQAPLFGESSGELSTADDRAKAALENVRAVVMRANAALEEREAKEADDGN